jgi:hypothetical protein
VGEDSMQKSTTLVYLNECDMEIEEQAQHVDNTDYDYIYILQYVYIDTSDDSHDDLDNIMMYIFGNNVAFIDPELFNVDPVPSHTIEFAYSTFHL